jgi:membrane fusion protein (multidrug efflux system)
VLFRSAQINQKHIKAPFAGRLGIRQVNLGQYVSPGQTSVVSLQSMDPLYLDFYLPEQYYKQIKIDQPITFTVQEFPDLIFEGKISAINSKIDLTTHNVQVQATLANCPTEAVKDPKNSTLIKTKTIERSDKLIINCNSDDNRNNKVNQFVFIPGMFSSIQIKQAAEPNTIIVPSTAISYSLYGNSVYLIEKSKESGKNGEPQLVVKRIFVATGEQEGNYTVIKRGIKAGQEIVSTGDLKLQNGTPIRINNSVKLDSEPNVDKIGQ